MRSFCASSTSENATRAANSNSLTSACLGRALLAFLTLVGVSMTFSAQNSSAVEPDTTQAYQLQVYQLDGIVVVANGEETPAREIGSSVTVITAEQIKQSQKQSVAELLRTVPGLDVVQTGARGGQTSIFMRGANSGHTLVIVDGIEMNDPSSPNGAFDFADLSVDNIERIEVLRGSQSILYGSDAIGGVISIVTKDGVGDPQTTLSANFGAYSTSKLAATTSASNLRTSYSISASRTDTKGFSATESRPSSERDGYGLTTLSGRIEIRPTEYAKLRFSGRSSQSETELDKSFSNFGNFGILDDLNNVQQSRKSFLKSEVDVTSANSKWRAKAFVTLASTQRKVNDSPDEVFGFGSETSDYDSEISRFGFKGIISPIAKQRLIVGVETERDLLSQTTDFGFGVSGLNGSNARTTGVYALGQLNANDRLFATVGLRNDDHDLFGNHTSFRITWALILPRIETKLKASFGDGFNAPTLFQMFDLSFGNDTLQPEESESWDIGVEQRFADDKLSVGATWFHQTIENIFGFDPDDFRTINIASAKSEGAEVFVAWLTSKLTTRIDYTYTNAIDKSNGSSLLRRAKNKVAARVDYRQSDATSAGLSLRHVGSRPDNDFVAFPAQRVSLASYTVVGFNAQHQIAESITLTGRVENLFDEKYQEVLRFATSGRALSFGVRYSL